MFCSFTLYFKTAKVNSFFKYSILIYKKLLTRNNLSSYTTLQTSFLIAIFGLKLQ
jgi:hypothetical protein